MRPTVTRGPVVSYTAVSPLPVEDGRSVLCCAISQVTLGGRYPPSCSMEPGSSSADPNEDHGRGHQEVSSLQLYIRCGKGGIPPYGEAMTLPGYPVFSMVVGIVGRFVNDAPNIGWGVSGVLRRVVWRRIKSVRAWYVRERARKRCLSIAVFTMTNKRASLINRYQIFL